MHSHTTDFEKTQFSTIGPARGFGEKRECLQQRTVLA